MTDARRDWTTAEAEAYRAGVRAGIERAAALELTLNMIRDDLIDERDAWEGALHYAGRVEDAAAAIRALLTEGEAHG